MAGGTTVGSAEIAGLGVTKAGKPANFAEPGVPPKKKKRVVINDPAAPLKRSALKSLMGFREWIDSDRGV